MNDITFNTAVFKNEKAIAYFKQKGISPTRSYAELQAYEHATAFTVAGLMDEDLLKDTRNLVLGSIQDGLSYHDFKKQLLPKLMAKGWLSKANITDKATLKHQKRLISNRLKLIYHTNKSTSYASGQWQRIQDSKGLLSYLQYRPSLSVNKRDNHKKYYNLIRPVDDEIWQVISPRMVLGVSYLMYRYKAIHKPS